jgi:hypothetical protein|tara:strand:- start:3 stop:308 length:306 start_codon:yes stop_codon:yes gene_type:complete
MGVTLNETITLANGLTVTNPYASLGSFSSLGRNEIRVIKDTNNYTIQGEFMMWVTHDLRVNESGVIGNIIVRVDTETPPTGNIYELLYNKLKTMKTCTDSI